MAYAVAVIYAEAAPKAWGKPEPRQVPAGSRPFQFLGYVQGHTMMHKAGEDTGFKFATAGGHRLIPSDQAGMSVVGKQTRLD